MNNSLEHIYSVIGVEVKCDELLNLFSKISPKEQEQIFGACSRLHLVDSIQYTKFEYEPWALINADALQIYLLCTCFDALAEISVQSVGNRFRGLFNGLNKYLKDEIIQSYCLLQEPEENILYWEELSTDAKMFRIIEYIYELRRNTFTHQAKILPAAFASRGISGYVCIIPAGIWTKYSVYFRYRFSQHCEPALLRLIIIGRIRIMLGLLVDDKFISYYWQNLGEFVTPSQM